MPTDIPVSNVAAAPDGGAILMMTNASPQVFEGVDGNGHRKWQTAMPMGGWNSVRSVRFAGDDVYFVLTNNVIYGGGNPLVNGLIVKLSLSSGAVEWSTTVPYVFAYSPRLVLDSNHAQVISFEGWGNKTRLQRFAMSDGTPLGSKFETCGVDQCVLYQSILATDGTLRMVHDTTDYFSGSAFELTTLQNEFDTIFADGFGF